MNPDDHAQEPRRSSADRTRALRLRAQELLRDVPPRGKHETRDMVELIHELDVHQAELEIQNEELLHAQRELEESQARYRQLYDQAPVAYVTLDGQGRVYEANATALALLAPGGPAVLGRTLSSLCLPEDGLTLERAIKEARETGHARPREIRLRDHDTAPVVVRADMVVAALGSERAQGCLVILTDVSEHARLQAELEHSEALLRSIFDGMDDALLVTDEAGRIKISNRRAAEMLGAKPEQLVGTLADAWLLPAQGAPTQEARVWEARTRNGLLEVKGRRADGTTFPGQLSLTTFEVARVALCVGVLRDQSQQQELERQLLHARKMESIGTLASGIAHDFNNILMAIIGCSELALGGIAPESKGRRFVEEVISSANRGAALTRQLLDFSRKSSNVVVRVAVDDVVRAADRLMTRLLPESITLKMACGAKGSHILAEQGQVEQILLNLAVNARDAMPQGGTLSVSTSSLEFDRERRHHVGHEHVSGERRHILVPPGHYVVLQVVDDGIGMDRETQARAFDPFFTTKASGAGTGLGLASVFGIVKRLGGYLDLESAPRAGTRFTFYLPRHEVTTPELPSPLPPTPRHPGASPPGRGHVALVVEDEPLVLLTARHYLEALGFRTLAARDGEEAMELAEAQAGPIDLLLTDVVMPEMGGFELAQALRDKRPALQVLFMSGNLADDLVRRGLLSEHDVVLQKPFGMQALEARISEVLPRLGAGQRT
jgi:PAS domain S-box-containing protein